MNKKYTISLYKSHGDEWKDSDLQELSDELSSLTDKEIKVKQDVTPDGEELIFIIDK